MKNNLDKYKSELKALIKEGGNLVLALKYISKPSRFKEQLKANGFKNDDEVEVAISKLPSFATKYQSWYTEAQACIKQILPDRLADFIKLYQKPTARKEINHETYSIEDALMGIQTSRGDMIIADPSSAVPRLEQQVSILKSAERRFESSLFEIKQLVQADIFDSELEAAKELLSKGFARAAGAIAGVLLERHLAEICHVHNLTVQKKNPTINDLNEALKNNAVIEMAMWRHIQYMGDLRNLADHSKSKNPTDEQMNDLITGVNKVMKQVH